MERLPPGTPAPTTGYDSFCRVHGKALRQCFSAVGIPLPGSSSTIADGCSARAGSGPNHRSNHPSKVPITPVIQRSEVSLTNRGTLYFQRATRNMPAMCSLRNVALRHFRLRCWLGRAAIDLTTRDFPSPPAVDSSHWLSSRRGTNNVTSSTIQLKKTAATTQGQTG
jgi:hypothetical protein